jgi:acetolactate synthase-1/2/3 large subunit
MGFGAMDFGVAGVLGAKSAAPDRPCVSVCGDGALFMHASLLGTAVDYDLPVVWVVWNNYAYASIRGLQRGYLGGRELATDFKDPRTGQRYNPDFAAMARSAGVEGVRVDRAADIGEALRKGIVANRPHLIDVDVAAGINPAGAGVWELPGLGRSKPSIGTRYIPSARGRAVRSPPDANFRAQMEEPCPLRTVPIATRRTKKNLKSKSNS